jgi:E3 UFM1-protein ligase 1
LHTRATVHGPAAADATLTSLGAATTPQAASPTLEQEAGALHLGDIAQRTRLGVDLLAPALAARLGALIPGKLEGGLLYTEAHVARVRVTL